MIASSLELDDRGQAAGNAFGALTLARIEKHVHRADYFPGGVIERGGKGHERHALAVRPLGNGFAAAHHALFLQGDRHRALIVRQRRAVQPVQPPRTAPLIAVQSRPVAPQCHRRLVEIGDPSFEVGHIDSGGQDIENLGGMALRFELQHRRPMLQSRPARDLGFGQARSCLRHCAPLPRVLKLRNALGKLWFHDGWICSEELGSAVCSSNRVYSTSHASPARPDGLLSGVEAVSVARRVLGLGVVRPWARRSETLGVTAKLL